MTNKIHGLEIIRFFSSVAVLLWHYQHFFYVVDKPQNFIPTQQPLYSYLNLFYDYGYLGVQVFWCISGYIFFWKYRDRIASGLINAKEFFMLRFSRLYPLHLLTLIFIALSQFLFYSQKNYFFVYQDNSFYNFFLHLFMISNWGFEKGTGFNGPIWSISIEILAYLIFFVLLRVLGKSFFYNLLIIVISWILLKLNIQYNITSCILFFYIGGSVAILQLNFQRYKKTLSYLSIVALIIIFVDTFILMHKQNEITLLLFSLPPILILITEYFNPSGFFASIIESLGNLTYASYLLHFPIQITITLFYTYIEKNIPYYNINFFLLYISLVLLFSRWTYLKFEYPIQQILRAKYKGI